MLYTSPKLLKLRYTLIVMAILVGCSRDELPPGEIGGGFTLTDTLKHKMAKQILKEQNIPFETNDNGHVMFLLKDQAKVKSILRQLEYGEELSHNIYETEVLLNDEDLLIYQKVFKEAGIPYQIYEKGGLKYIEWRQDFGPKVDVLIQKIHESERTN